MSTFEARKRKGWSALRRAAVMVLIVGSLIASACTDDNAPKRNSDPERWPAVPEERGSPLSTADEAPPRSIEAPPDAPRHDGSYLPVDQLAELADCSGATPVPGEELAVMAGEPAPTAAITCGTAAGMVQLREYTTEAEVDAAIAASRSTCGYRTVGQRWIAAADVPEALRHLAQIIGGELVTFDGCTGDAVLE